MIFLNFFARALAFHVLLIPVITLLGAVILLTLIRLEKASASLRAGISGATLIVILILPWAAMTVPKVTIPIFSSVPDAQTESINRHLPPAGVILPPPVLSQAPEVVSEPIPSAELSKASPTTKPSPYRFNWRVLSAVVILALICVWILGVIWGLGILILGMVGIFRLRLSSHLVADDRLVEALHASCARLNFRGSVLFLISDRVALPITWGWLRAKIALPQDALNWPAERIDAALLHELAHIKRHDFAIQTMSRLTCVFHWYNPLVLRLFRVWKNEAEQACDDLVLRSGYSGERYSDILLEVWRSATIPRPQSSLGLAMVRTSTLEQRVIAILDPQREREEVSPRNKLQLFAIFGGITILIAVIGLTRPTNYHLTPELQNDMQAILRQVRIQEDAHLALQLQLERHQEYWSSAKGTFAPQPQATAANITLELSGPKVSYRANYHPLVSLWVHGPAPYYIDNRTDVSDGNQTETILSQHKLNYESQTTWRTGRDIGLLAGFHYRANDEVRSVIEGLEGNGLMPFNGSSYGIERTILNGTPAVRLQEIVTLGGAARRTWWFDPQRDYALTRYELANFNNGSSQPSYSEITSIEQLQNVADGVWYPTQFSTQSFRYVDGQLTDDSFRSSTKITSLVTLPSISPATFQTLATDASAISPAGPSAQPLNLTTITPEPPSGIQFEKIAIQDQNPAGSSRLWKLSANGHSFQAHLSPGNYNFRIIGQTHSGQLYFSEPHFLKVEDSGPEQVNLDAFTPAFHVTGSLDASVPRPIKNGMVLACVTTGFTDPSTGWLTWNSTVEIHPDGTFEISNLPTPQGLPKSTGSIIPPLVGQLELIAKCDGYISKDPATKRMEYAVGRQVFDPPVPQPVTLTMEPLGSARVRVLDPQGNPLAGAIVRFSPNESFRWISTLLGSPIDDEKTLFVGQNGDPTWKQLQERYQATTDQDGVAVVKGLPSGLEPYIVLNTSYDVPYRLRLDQSSTKYTQNGVVVTEPGTEVSAEMRLIPKIAPIVIPNATSPDGKYVVSVEPSQGLPMSVAEPQSVVVRDAKTGKYVNSTFLPSNPDRQVDLVGSSDMVKAQWNSTSSFFIFSVLHKDRLEFTVVAFNSKDIGMATSDIGVSYGHDLKVISLELTGERTFKAKIQQKDGNTFYRYATVNNVGQVTMGSEPNSPKASTQNSQSQGKVLNAKGEPVANAAISLVSAGQLLTITDGQIDPKAESILSASDGGFTLNRPGVAGDLLVVVHEDGYAVIPCEKFSGTITLTSWAKVSGTALGETMLAAQKSVEFQMSIPLNPRISTEGQVRLLSRATVDSQGSFLASHAPIGVVDAMLAAGPLSDQHSLLDQHSLMETIHIETQADQTARADFGGKGITVTGKAEMPNDPDLDLNWGQIFWARSPVGLNIPSGMPQVQADKLTREYYASDAGKKALLATRVQYFHVQPDGSFKIENVSPGSYELRIDFIHKPAQGGRNWPVGNTSSSVEVKAGDTSVDVPLLKLHLLPKPPNSTTSNDARNPSLPASLQMEAEKLTIDEIAALEHKVASDPSDLPDRVRILGYYFLKRISQSSAQDAAQPHLLWIIRNLPASTIAGNPIASVDYRTDLPHYEEASEAWKEALAKYPNDPKVIGNAAAFYLLNEPKRAEKLLLQGQKLEPNNTAWAMRLGQLYTLRSMGPDLSVKTASKAEALKWFEQGLSSLQGINRFYGLEAPAKAAFEAGDFATAHQYAQELLQMAPQYPKDWNYGNAIYTGNSILGQIALAQGDIASAKNYLEAAGDSPGSPQLNSFGPDLTLARELLDKGEKNATVAFLGKISKFWTGQQGKIQGWQTAIQQGQTTF